MNRATRTAGVIVLILGVAGCSSTPPRQAVVDPDISESTGEAEFYRFDEPPVLTEFVSPEYPEAARASGLEGSVMVRVLVDTDGRVRELKVLKSSDPVFEPAALAAASRWVFKPAKWQHKATRSFVAVPVQFALD